MAFPPRSVYDERCPRATWTSTMMDPDKKGYVTKEEFLKFEAKLFEKADKNKDGHLSMTEFTDRG